MPKPSDRDALADLLHEPDSPFAPPYRDEPYVEYPLVPLRPHTRQELEAQVKSLHQDGMMRLLNETETAPEPVPLLLSSDVMSSDDIVVIAERVHALLQLISHIQSTSHQALLKRIYKRYLPDHRKAAKCLYLNEHFAPAFTQYHSLLSSLLSSSSKSSSKRTPTLEHIKATPDLLHATIDLLEKLSVTALRLHWPHDALRLATLALALEPCSTRARLWLASAHLGLGPAHLPAAREHLAYLPQPGHFPEGFPRWIEDRVGVQRRLLERMEREAQGVYEVDEMHKEECDRVPEVVRAEARLGIELDSGGKGGGWRTKVKVKKGEVVLVAPPVAVAPCFVEAKGTQCETLGPRGETMMVLEDGRVVRVVKTGRAGVREREARERERRATVKAAKGKAARSSPMSPLVAKSAAPAPALPSTSTLTTTGPITPSDATKPLLSSSSAPGKPTLSGLNLDVTLDDSFSFLLHTDELFNSAAQKADVALAVPSSSNALSPRPALSLVQTTPSPKPPVVSGPPPPFMTDPAPRPLAGGAGAGAGAGAYGTSSLAGRHVPPSAFKYGASMGARPVSSLSNAHARPTSTYSTSGLHTTTTTTNADTSPPPHPHPSLHTTDPTPLSLALLTHTLYNAAKTSPTTRSAIRSAAARASKKAEGVIDLMSGSGAGCDVRAASLVAAVAYGVAIAPSPEPDDVLAGSTANANVNANANANANAPTHASGDLGEEDVIGCVYENAHGARTLHAGHGVYLPLLRMMSVPRGKANTEAGFVGPYLFLRAKYDLPPNTPLTFDGFSCADILPVYPPRGVGVGDSGGRRRRVGIVKTPVPPAALADVKERTTTGMPSEKTVHAVASVQVREGEEVREGLRAEVGEVGMAGGLASTSSVHVAGLGLGLGSELDHVFAYASGFGASSSEAVPTREGSVVGHGAHGTTTGDTGTGTGTGLGMGSTASLLQTPSTPATSHPAMRLSQELQRAESLKPASVNPNPNPNASTNNTATGVTPLAGSGYGVDEMGRIKRVSRLGGLSSGRFEEGEKRRFSAVL